jgi:hypothetical protein
MKGEKKGKKGNNWIWTKRANPTNEQIGAEEQIMFQIPCQLQETNPKDKRMAILKSWVVSLKEPSFATISCFKIEAPYIFYIAIDTFYL